MQKLLLAVLSLGASACFGGLYAGAHASSGVAGTQQASSGDVAVLSRQSAARTLGYPTRKTKADLDAVIQRQTANFTTMNVRGQGRLEAPASFAVQAKRRTCYTVIMRLADGAAWDVGAEGGLRFDFQTPTTHGSGGPGLTGPGAVVSLGCADIDGPITLTMAPLFGHDPIGHGGYTLEVLSHKLTDGEYKKQQQAAREDDARAEAFARSEKAKNDEKLSGGCAKCNARYQGCLGSGQSQSACQSRFSSCAFEEAGVDYYKMCPHPN